MRNRWLLLALIVGALAVVPPDVAAATTTAGPRGGQRGRHGRHLGHGDLGRRGASFVPGRHRRVQGALSQRQRQVHVGRRQPRAVALDRGPGREPARHRLHRPARAHEELRRAGRDPADRRSAGQDRRTTSASRSRTSAPSTASSTRSCSRARTSRPSGTTSPTSRRPASSPPETWEDLTAAADTLKAAGITPYSVGVDVGWPISDLFENVYIRQAGAEKYDQLDEPRDPVDGPVGEGRADDHAGHRRRLGRPGRRDRRRAPDRHAGVRREGVQRLPGGGDGRHRRLRSGRRDRQPARAGDGLQRVHVPVDRRLGAVVVGGGDLCVELQDERGRDGLPRLPDDARCRGDLGRSAAGSRRRTRTSTTSVYPDDITRTNATALANAEEFRFDMSDLQPSAFGGTPGRACSRRSRTSWRSPNDVDGVTQQMETDAKKAFSKLGARALL